MTETRDPGTPRTEVYAHNTALHAISRIIAEGRVDLTEDGVGDTATNSWTLATDVVRQHTAAFEYDNDLGVAVRRYVLRGQWFVDPDPDSAPADTEPVDTDTETKLRGAVEVMADSRDLWRKRAIEAGWDGKPAEPVRVSMANHGVPAGSYISEQTVRITLDGMLMLLDGMPRVSTPLGFDTVKVERVRELILRTAGSLGVTL